MTGRFNFTIPYPDGHAVKNATLNMSVMQGPNAYNATRCLKPLDTCPPDSAPNCKRCPDRSNYPCYRPNVLTGVPGRCLAPMGSWNAFSAGTVLLYVKVQGFPYMDVAPLYFYDPSTLITSPISPLVIPCVKRSADETSSISIYGDSLEISMTPKLKLTRTSSGMLTSYEFEGTCSTFLPS